MTTAASGGGGGGGGGPGPGLEAARAPSGARYPPRVIVVIGSPTARSVDGVLQAAGTASRVALAAARGGRSVQLVGKTGDDATADAIVLDLARGGVGHVALLRDAGEPDPGGGRAVR